jgi:hypothetical protein
VTGQSLSRHAYGATVAVLAAAICIVAGFLLLVALPDVGGLTGLLPGATEAPSATPGPSSQAATGMSPIGIQMPDDANCDACHVTTAGTVGTKEIPYLGHPLWGFRSCTECHANDRLVKTAPGHSSLHKEDCLVCHEVNPKLAGGASIAPMRPEHMGTTQECTSCHGVDEHAPLPDSMAQRENCWMCHNGPEYTYLFESDSPGSSPNASAPTGAAGGRVTP